MELSYTAERPQYHRARVHIVPAEPQVCLSAVRASRGTLEQPSMRGDGILSRTDIAGEDRLSDTGDETGGTETV